MYYEHLHVCVYVGESSGARDRADPPRPGQRERRYRVLDTIPTKLRSFIYHIRSLVFASVLGAQGGQGGGGLNFKGVWSLKAIWWVGVGGWGLGDRKKA